MTNGTGKGAPDTRRLSLSLAAALSLAAGLIAFTQVSIANGAEGHGHHHTHAEARDPSLGQTVGEKSRFSKMVSLTGEIWMVEAHNPKNGHPYLKLLKTRDDRMFGLYGSGAESLKLGNRYEVTGLVDSSPANFQAATSADILVSDVRQLPSPRRTNQMPQLSETGKAGFITAFVTWPGSGPTTFDRDVARAKEVGDWSSSASNGKFRWDPVEMVEVRLPEPLAPCGSQGETPSSLWVEDVRAALAEKGFDLANDFRALGIAFPEGGSICSPGAAAYAFGSDNCRWMESNSCGLSVYGFGYTTKEILVHELGHNLGAPHAHAAPCTEGRSAVVLNYSNGCQRDGGGDKFDPMGRSHEAAILNPVYADQLGWLDPTEVRRISHRKSVDLEVSLSPYAGPSGERVVQAQLPLVPSQGGLRSPGRLYAEYRARVGLDQLLYPGGGTSPWHVCQDGVNNAIYLRIVPNSVGRELTGLGPGERPPFDSYILDNKPETTSWGWDSPGLCDAGLQPGDSWQDPTGRLKIDFVRRAADLSTAAIRVRSEGTEGNDPILELEKVGEGRGKIVVKGTDIECDGKCTEVLEDDSRVTIRAVPARGSVFRFWMGDCNSFSFSYSCALYPELGQKLVVRAGFDPDPNFPRPDINLSTLQLTPANLKVRSGKKARFSVQVTNAGLDEGEAKVSLSSSAPGKARVPGSVSFKVPGESSATGSFTVTTRKKQKGKVTITARLGSQTARANVVLAK